MRDGGSPSKLSDDELAAWQGLLRANAWLVRELEADLQRTHGLPPNGYDVLLQLALAPGHSLRMSRLAEEVLMSHNGLTRVVAQLEERGLVARAKSENDRRVVDATLTPQGRSVMRAASRTHLAGVRERFLDRLSAEQLHQLRSIWDAVDPTLVAGRHGPASV